MDSTNRVALELARAGPADGVVVVADHQTAGRGRRGRVWESAAGASLLASLVLRTDRLFLSVAAVSLAARDACSSVAGFVPDLKWPNDLVVGDAKLAGVLAEAEAGVVVVGLGLNVAADAPWPAGAVAAETVAGRAVDRAALFDGVLAGVAARLGRWDDVASEYRRACSTLHRVVRVDLADEFFTGTAADLTDDGHLLVDVGMCLRTVAAGDVVHLRPAVPD